MSQTPPLCELGGSPKGPEPGLCPSCLRGSSHPQDAGRVGVVGVSPSSRRPLVLGVWSVLGGGAHSGLPATLSARDPPAS